MSLGRGLLCGPFDKEGTFIERTACGVRKSARKARALRICAACGAFDRVAKRRVAQNPVVRCLGRVGQRITLAPIDGLCDGFAKVFRSEEHTSELQSRGQLVCRLLLEKK